MVSCPADALLHCCAILDVTRYHTWIAFWSHNVSEPPALDFSPPCWSSESLVNYRKYQKLQKIPKQYEKVPKITKQYKNKTKNYQKSPKNQYQKKYFYSNHIFAGQKFMGPASLTTNNKVLFCRLWGSLLTTNKVLFCRLWGSFLTTNKVLFCRFWGSFLTTLIRP